MSQTTLKAYRTTIKLAKKTFDEKHGDYGSSWRILRERAFVDAIMIKGKRIRSIQEKRTQKITDSIEQELIGIINYSIMALIQVRLKEDKRMEIPLDELTQHYEAIVKQIEQLLQNKNHDYQEAWRDMAVSSMVDIILVRVLRIVGILKKEGRTLVSEGIEANYRDMVNYAVFCLILLREKK